MCVRIYSEYTLYLYVFGEFTNLVTKSRTAAEAAAGVDERGAVTFKLDDVDQLSFVAREQREHH